MKLLIFEIKINEAVRVESKYLFRLVAICFISRRCCFHFIFFFIEHLQKNFLIEMPLAPVFFLQFFLS